MRLSIILLLFLFLPACDNEKPEPTEEDLKNVVELVRELVSKGDASRLAGLYVIQEGRSETDSLQFARTLLREIPENGFVLRELRISGNMGVALLADSKDGPPYLIWAHWRDGTWKLFPSFTIWSHTKEIEDFGLSKKEMDHAYKLELWALSRMPEG